MLFNSYEFIFLYLPIVFFGYFYCAKAGNQYALLWLSCASLFFYGWWNFHYLLLLSVSIIFNFYAAKLMLGISADTGRKLVVSIAITSNFLMLLFYKYMNFFIETINQVSGSGYSTMNLLLPLGISFFTFTQIAFLVDVYEKKVTSCEFINYILFVSFMPHLIAGPLIHHKQMMPQFLSNNKFIIDSKNVAIGLTYFACGLAKKVLIADSFSKYSTIVFNGAGDGQYLNFLITWTGALSYTFQIYFDFSGYSDMAVGISRMFNIKLPLNFNSPYRATSIIDFWRRWHITLSNFLKDYLYIPLGGGRRGELRRYTNLLVTMLLGGMWHGANWTFLVWGGLHGFFLAINHFWNYLKTYFNLQNTLPHLVGVILGACLTFICVITAWVFFRANDINTAIKMIGSMYLFDKDGLSIATFPNQLERFRFFLNENGLSARNFMILVAASLSLVWLFPNSQQYIEGNDGSFKWVNSLHVAIFWGVIIAVCLINMATVSEFLYFQF